MACVTIHKAALDTVAGIAPRHLFIDVEQAGPAFQIVLRGEDRVRAGSKATTRKQHCIFNDRAGRYVPFALATVEGEAAEARAESIRAAVAAFYAGEGLGFGERSAGLDADGLMLVCMMGQIVGTAPFANKAARTAVRRFADIRKRLAREEAEAIAAALALASGDYGDDADIDAQLAAIEAALAE